MRRSRRCGGRYAIIAGRARMLSEPFADRELYEGGVGAGTVIGYRLRIGRHERAFVLAVEEPARGRQLRARPPRRAAGDMDLEIVATCATRFNGTHEHEAYWWAAGARVVPHEVSRRHIFDVIAVDAGTARLHLRPTAGGGRA
jgi:hypothetical protein